MMVCGSVWGHLQSFLFLKKEITFLLLNICFNSTNALTKNVKDSLLIMLLILRWKQFLLDKKIEDILISWPFESSIYSWPHETLAEESGQQNAEESGQQLRGKLRDMWTGASFKAQKKKINKKWTCASGLLLSLLVRHGGSVPVPRLLTGIFV